MKKFRINRIILLLMLSDVFVSTGFGLVEPIIAIYISENISGGSIFSAGIASSIFFITKSLVQLPFSRYVDLHDNKIHWLLVGTFITMLVPFLYIFSPNIWTLYFTQFIYGIGSGLSYPTWLGLWSVNLDKNHESFEWSLYSTITGIGIAMSASMGAALSDFMGFKFTFVLVGMMSLIGCIILLALEKKHYRQKLLNPPIDRNLKKVRKFSKFEKLHE